MSPPRDSSPTDTALSKPAASSASEFSPEERKTLLELARESIMSVFEGREIPTAAPSPHMAEPRGAFTTIYCEGELRGCVGYVFAIAPLYRTVVETARAAAFEDSRFLPIRREEARNLQISISVLSPLKPIRPEEVEVGRHGLMASMAGQRGLLLPQVAVEHGWDQLTFLEQTCRKAGLPLDAWRKGAALEAFTAEVFGDEEVKPASHQ